MFTILWVIALHSLAGSSTCIKYFNHTRLESPFPQTREHKINSQRLPHPTLQSSYGDCIREECVCQLFYHSCWSNCVVFTDTTQNSQHVTRARVQQLCKLYTLHTISISLCISHYIRHTAQTDFFETFTLQLPVALYLEGIGIGGSREIERYELGVL